MTMLITTVINCSVNNFVWKVPAPLETQTFNTHVCMASKTNKKELDHFEIYFFRRSKCASQTLTRLDPGHWFAPYVCDNQREGSVPSVHSHC